MILTFPEVIASDEHRAILDQVARSDFVDGRETAAAGLASVKNNEQIARGSAPVQVISNILLDALRRNPAFRAAAYPKQLHSTMVSRYRTGMGYGAHVDNALMGDAQVFRTDLSLTLFLNEPGDYDGGELVIEDTFGVQSVKLEAGNLILYPASSLHHVRPVTRGARVSSFFWIQSMVRDDGERTLLFDLDLAIQRLGADHPDHPTALQLTGVYHNLLRRWASL